MLLDLMDTSRKLSVWPWHSWEPWSDNRRKTSNGGFKKDVVSSFQFASCTPVFRTWIHDVLRSGFSCLSTNSYHMHYLRNKSTASDVLHWRLDWPRPRSHRLFVWYTCRSFCCPRWKFKSRSFLWLVRAFDLGMNCCSAPSNSHCFLFISSSQRILLTVMKTVLVVCLHDISTFPFQAVETVMSPI